MYIEMYTIYFLPDPFFVDFALRAVLAERLADVERSLGDDLPAAGAATGVATFLAGVPDDFLAADGVAAALEGVAAACLKGEAALRGVADLVTALLTGLCERVTLALFFAAVTFF
jgi:hypothetical protein